MLNPIAALLTWLVTAQVNIRLLYLNWRHGLIFLIKVSDAAIWTTIELWSLVNGVIRPEVLRVVVGIAGTFTIGFNR
jgi:hypothetical protein